MKNTIITGIIVLVSTIIMFVSQGLSLGWNRSVMNLIVILSFMVFYQIIKNYIMEIALNSHYKITRKVIRLNLLFQSLNKYEEYEKLSNFITKQEKENLLQNFQYFLISKNFYEYKLNSFDDLISRKKEILQMIVKEEPKKHKSKTRKDLLKYFKKIEEKKDFDRELNLLYLKITTGRYLRKSEYTLIPVILSTMAILGFIVMIAQQVLKVDAFSALGLFLILAIVYLFYASIMEVINYDSLVNEKNRELDTQINIIIDFLESK